MKLPISILTIALICFSCKTQKPPVEVGKFKTTDLVELIQLDNSIHLDIKYATSANLTGKPVYKEARAFLQRDAAFALVKASTELKKLGYGLLVFDGYRPWSVTKLFWDKTSKENKRFVADPKLGSKHNRGCAVDLSLYDLKTGKEVKMPGEYDEMSDRSYPNYTGGTEQERQLRDLLRSKMEEQGFNVYDYEWWHFDFKDWTAYRIGNIPFSEIK
jgi:zinc D-Ala-D-Ala dipeptidase